jgi:hypothetical protein
LKQGRNGRRIGNVAWNAQGFAGLAKLCRLLERLKPPAG